MSTTEHQGNYLQPVASISAIPRIRSGCRLLDCALGGGWARGRVINIVGDRSTGKTLQAIEMCANFAAQYPEGMIMYRDGEAAFDMPYAGEVGLPEGRVSFGDEDEDFDTVNDFERDLTSFLKKLPQGVPGLYVLDSLDSLSDDEEMDPKYNEDGTQKGSYGTGKAKKMSAMFRRLVRIMRKKECTLVIISQVRDAIGVMFGEKHTRTGGRALDFYASQIVWISDRGKIKKVKGGLERSVGIDVSVNVKKNKCGRPHRIIDYPIYFSYGIDDVRAGLQFLAQAKRLDAIGLADIKVDSEDEAPQSRGRQKKGGSAGLTKFMNSLDTMGNEEYTSFRKKVNKAVVTVWEEVEATFAPVRRKYQ